MANMADITTAAASDPGSPRESAPPPRGRASPFPSLPPSSPFPSLACPPTLSAARPARGSVLSLGPLWGERVATVLRSATRAVALWQVPGAQVNSRLRACASAFAAPTPRSLGAREEGAGHNSRAEIREDVEVFEREWKTIARATTATTEPVLIKRLSPRPLVAPANSHPPILTSPGSAKGPFCLSTQRGADLPGVARPEKHSRSP